MNDKEEMIIVNDNQDLIVINQLPVISEQLDMVKAEIQRRTAFADTVTVSEENRQEIKKIRAAMNAEKSRLDEVYKKALEAVIAPIQVVQDKYKDCVGLYTKANSQLKAKIDVIEDGLKPLRKDSQIIDSTLVGISKEGSIQKDCPLSSTVLFLPKM